jgi:hypothetical protein
VPHLLAEWRASFPAAIACRLESATLTKGQLSQLKRLTSFTSVGFRSKAEANEQPLAVVRTMSHIEALTVVESASARRTATRLALAPAAAVWGELGSLRELSLELGAAVMPATLLSSLNGAVLRKLSLRICNSGWDERAGIVGLITDAGLAGLPLLEELGGADLPEMRQSFRLGTADADAARWLGVAPGAAVGRLRRALRDREGVVVYWSDAAFRADAVVFEAVLTRR